MILLLALACAQHVEPVVETAPRSTMVIPEITHVDPGSLKIAVDDLNSPVRAVEIVCGSHRERVSVVGHLAVYEDVPADDCRLFFKGAVPAQFYPVGPGALRCRFVGSTAVCGAI